VYLHPIVDLLRLFDIPHYRVFLLALAT
jgi:hypothetical protein